MASVFIAFHVKIKAVHCERCIELKGEKTCQMFPHYEWLQYRSGNGKVLIGLRRNLMRKCEGVGIIYYQLLTESWWKVNSQMDKRRIASEKVRDFRICGLNFPLQYNKHWDSRTKPIDRAIVQEVKPASPDLTHTHIQVLAKFSSRMSKFRVRGFIDYRGSYTVTFITAVSVLEGWAQDRREAEKERTKGKVKDREMIVETGQRRNNHKEKGVNRGLV